MMRVSGVSIRWYRSVSSHWTCWVKVRLRLYLPPAVAGAVQWYVRQFQLRQALGSVLWPLRFPVPFLGLAVDWLPCGGLAVG